VLEELSTGCYASVCRLAQDLNEEEMQKERAKRDRLFRKKRNRNGLGRNGAFAEHLLHMFLSSRGSEGFTMLQWEFMVEPTAVWATEYMFRDVLILPSDALQVVLQVIELRKDEMPSSGDEEFTLSYGDAAYYCCYVIAKQLRGASDYLGAVPWAELSMFYANQSQGEMMDEHLADGHLLLSKTYATADMWTKSLQEFDAGAAIVDNEQEGRDAILSGLKE